MFHAAILDEDVIPAALDRDVIIADIDIAIPDEHVGAHAGVHRIGVGRVGWRLEFRVLDQQIGDPRYGTK